MAKEHPVLEELKRRKMPTRPVSLRVPEDLHKVVQTIMEKTGATYTEVAVELMRLGAKQVEK